MQEQEAEHISATPQSPASAPATISCAPETTNGDGAEVVDLAPTTPPPVTPPPDPPIERTLPPDTPPVRMLASSTPPVTELQLEAGLGEELEPPAPLLGTPAPRIRRSVIPRQLKRNSVAPMPREPLRNRQVAKQSSSGCMFPDTLKPLDKPRESLQMFFHQLDSQEWEVVMQGLQTLVRLCRHHPDTVQAHLHAVLVALARQIRNLRSQVSRAACQTAGELFLVLKRAIETDLAYVCERYYACRQDLAHDLAHVCVRLRVCRQDLTLVCEVVCMSAELGTCVCHSKYACRQDLDQVVAPLFHRAADTNKFLRADSNAALDKMVDAISTNRAVTAICSKGASHQHALVRTAAARLLAGIVTRLGAERTMSLPRDTRDKILVTGASLLTEGSLDTRCFAKQMFRVLATQPSFFYVMTEVVPAPVMRNIGKILQALK
ncbi:hypothetical protein PR048_022675 [Dryococelus australis]|uniref:TOG domain-containing protein n=1 Tax=Dryococelus australis TaxID=614101 RepID=A0ABQ9GRW1_9NEOP|nr:hypothetical protein PR048_022675 [Dryococelus australis]